MLFKMLLLKRYNKKLFFGTKIPKPKKFGTKNFQIPLSKKKKKLPGSL